MTSCLTGICPESCNNLPENGPLTAAVVRDLASDVDSSLLAWIEQNVDFATSTPELVERICDRINVVMSRS